jgi:hypothetical protein
MPSPRHPALIVAVGPFALAVGFTFACSSKGRSDVPCYEDPEACIDPEGTRTGFVVSSLEIPPSQALASTEDYALDLDDDPRRVRDNRLGELVGLASWATEGAVQPMIDDMIARGSINLLVDVQATDLQNAENIGVRVYGGRDPVPAACSSESDQECGRHLQGGGRFVASDAVQGVLAGTIESGLVQAGPARLQIVVRADFLDSPVTLRLEGLRGQASISASGELQGVVGGAISIANVHDAVLPILAGLANQDCGGEAPDCCEPDTFGAKAAELFDIDDDCQITAKEIATQPIVATQLEPDVDVLDEDGRFAPSQDGKKESIGLGVRFKAVRANFQAP